MLEYMDMKQMAKFHPKLKNRGRKGIPAIYRGQVWCQLSQMLVAGYHKQNLITQSKNPSLNIHDNKYELMAKGDIAKLIKNLINEEGNKKTMSEIHKDVSRTLPNHVYFQDQYLHGQNDLFCVLKCLSILVPEVGYVQGMGYIGAILLMYLDKEDTLQIMLRLLNSKPYNMKAFYLPDMPGLKKSFYVFLSLFKRFMPKLNQHMLDSGYMPHLYATQWFMTLFSTNIPIELTLRIWDIFLIQGSKIIYRIPLAFLKINEKQLLASEDVEAIRYILGGESDTSTNGVLGQQIQFPKRDLPENMKENEEAIDSISINLQKNKEKSNTFLKNIEKII